MVSAIGMVFAVAMAFIVLFAGEAPTVSSMASQSSC